MDVLALGERAAAVDGVEPFNEATRLALSAGDEPRADLRFATPTGLLVAAALGFGDAPVELVVDPAFRGGGLGRRLLEAVRKDGETSFWAHGDLPGAQALARRARLRPARTLLVLRRPAGPPSGGDLTDLLVRPYGEGDVDAILAVNARAFADHPEQGAMDLADFDRRRATHWFDPAGLFVAERDGAIVGFHWTKVEDGVGEVYVIGVDPSAQGSGVAAPLLAAGLDHLAARDVAAVDLYVEGDNARALALYARLGFTERARDVLYLA